MLALAAFIVALGAAPFLLFNVALSVGSVLGVLAAILAALVGSAQVMMTDNRKTNKEHSSKNATAPSQRGGVSGGTVAALTSMKLYDASTTSSGATSSSSSRSMMGAIADWFVSSALSVASSRSLLNRKGPLPDSDDNGDDDANDDDAASDDLASGPPSTHTQRLAGIEQHYNPASADECDALRAFKHVQTNTQCIFAPRAKLWGSRNWDDYISLDANIYRSIPMVLRFCQALDMDELLDGFVFAIPSTPYGATVDAFAGTVNRVLRMLSHYDPAGVRIMEKSYVGQRGWAFELAGEPFFVTTFAPFYPPNHSRHAFGARWDDSATNEGAEQPQPSVSPSTSTATNDLSPAQLSDRFCFVLLQPERSFVRRKIGDDTPHTNWAVPVTPRDRIRAAYRDAGREYIVPPSIHYPTANHIVEAVHPHSDPIVEFWKQKPVSG